MEGDVQELGASLTLLKPFGDDTQSKRLNLGLSFVLSGPIGQYARQIGDFGDPAAVSLALEFNLEGHHQPPSSHSSRSGGTRGSPHNTGDKLRSSNMLGFVCFIPLFDSFVIGRSSDYPALRRWD